MPQPLEALDRPTLERRYRRMRVVAAVLGASALLLGVALGVQNVTGQRNNASQNSSQENTADGGKAGKNAKPANQQCPVEDRRDPQDPRAIGAVDAPIVLHEWTDFRCPYCGAFSRDTLPTLIAEYVDTGKVRLEIHDAALVGGENSILIAAAARAAGDQGRYFEFYDAIYQTSAKQGEPRTELDIDRLIELARTAGVADIDTFRASAESTEYADAVREETAEAQRIGITGVPFFATSDCGQVLSGAQSLETFRSALDTAISAAKQ